MGAASHDLFDDLRERLVTGSRRQKRFAAERIGRELQETQAAGESVLVAEEMYLQGFGAIA